MSGGSFGEGETMSNDLSDDFLMATGLSAFVLIQATLEQVQQELGMPSEKIDEIVGRSIQILASVATLQKHAALPIAVGLLVEVAKKRAGRPALHTESTH